MIAATYQGLYEWLTHLQCDGTRFSATNISAEVPEQIYAVHAHMAQTIRIFSQFWDCGIPADGG